MRSYSPITIATVLVCLFVGNVHSDVSSCKYTDKATGKTYDFGTLINPIGHDTIKQEVWSIGGFSLDSLVADSQVNVTFYVQVCHNIATPPPGCSDVGALYSVTADGKCQSWGDANAAVFDTNPYKDGVNMKLYHGTAIDHLSNNAGIIYFVCNKGHNATVPAFEHVKSAINQAHFKFLTDLAC